MPSALVCTLDVPHRPGHNQIYCATFQMAWNELVRLGGGPIRLDGAPKAADALNARLGEAYHLDAGSYVALAGGAAERSAVDAAIASLGGAAELLPHALGPEELIAFAYLRKELEFQPHLARRDTPWLMFRGTDVASIGVWDDDDPDRWEARAELVTIHDFKADDDFVVELRTQASDDRLIVARMAPGPTLGDTVSRALARAGGASWYRRLTGAERLRRGERLALPVVSFQLDARYTELERRLLDPPKLSGRAIAVAAQRVRLDLDERGARLASEALIQVEIGMSRKRQLLCSGPFLVLLLRRAASAPYLALWVETTEVLKPLAPPGHRGG